ncbi:MAG: TPM domain-containing protein [Deltaproteobacteria bacterium]|nr:TPM domain-containing protein [Deltaproteobacteria bacterium]
MKTDRYCLPFFILLVLFLQVSTLFGAEPFPQPVGAVNDYAGVLSEQYRRSMESLAREVLQKTGASVVVVTMKSIGDADTDEYANRLYEAWGIGKKGEDRGVLIFLTLKERRIRIETGYGLEGILPDGRVGQILDTYVVPSLKKGDYEKGLYNAEAAVAAVIAADAGVSLEGTPYRVPAKRERSRPAADFLSYVVFILLLTLLLGTRQGRRMLPFILLMMMMGGRGSGGGGGFGGFGGGFGGFGGGMSGGGGAGRGF